MSESDGKIEMVRKPSFLTSIIDEARIPKRGTGEPRETLLVIITHTITSRSTVQWSSRTTPLVVITSRRANSG